MRISDCSDVCSSDLGQEHVLVLEAVVHAVGDGTVVVEAGKDFLDLAHDVVGAGDVEEGFLLAGEGGVGPVLGGRGGTHRTGRGTASVLIVMGRAWCGEIVC